MKLNINEIFNLYLSERKKVLAPKTFRYYDEMIDLMRHCLNSYGQLSLNEKQDKEYELKRQQGIEFCDIFYGEILEWSLFGEFLGYFLPRKVMIGQDTARKVCGASINFYKWLVANNYVKDDEIKETIGGLRDEFKISWKECNEDFDENEEF